MGKKPETNTGGSRGRFPTTRYSAIASLRKSDASEKHQAWESVVRMYWKPVYKYLRIKWRKSSEDAEDLTQGFFTSAIEKNFFHSYDPRRSRFRTFLRTCLDGYLANENKAAKTLKRGGGALFVPYDFHQAEIELKQSRHSPDEIFEREWIRALFSTALDAFRRSCEEQNKMIQFQIFEKYDLERDPVTKISYGELSETFGIPITTVTNYLSFARREFRKMVLRKLEEISGSQKEYRSDARRLFGGTSE
ncbi:sigma-70 family RNA polymerase sigma factor [bacterium]|nr:sigma-70 family RNA polymerase sigma factor [bacterium]